MFPLWGAIIAVFRVFALCFSILPNQPHKLKYKQVGNLDETDGVGI